MFEKDDTIRNIHTGDIYKINKIDRVQVCGGTHIAVYDCGGYRFNTDYEKHFELVVELKKERGIK